MRDHSLHLGHNGFRKFFKCTSKYLLISRRDKIFVGRSNLDHLLPNECRGKTYFRLLLVFELRTLREAMTFIHLPSVWLQQISFENLAPQVSRQICKELQQLISDPPEGIKVILNEEDISDIQAVIEGPGDAFSDFS